MAEKDKKKASQEDIPENVATTYGLEGHEANQSDPRVENLRTTHSQHANKTPSSYKNLNQIRSEQQLGRRRDTLTSVGPTPSTANYEATVPRERVITIDDGQKLTDNSELPPQPAPQPDPPAPQPAVRAPQPVAPIRHPVTPAPPSTATASDVNLPLQKSEPIDNDKNQSPLPVPIVLMPAPYPVRAERPEKPESISRETNTDVSFDPSKVFASKTTNTSGLLYTEMDELPPPKEPEPQPTAYPNPNLDDIFTFAVALVRRAGAFALQSNQRRLSYTTKEHEHDLNTRTDNEVEEIIVQAINDKYPDHKVIAEEAISASATGQAVLTNSPTWIIDPIDGTMNFVHHFPYYCISVAFLINKETAFGIVFNPPLQELYTARKGEGAKLNGDPMLTSGQDTLKNAMVLQEYSSGANDDRTTVAMENAKRLIKKAHALRSIGSSAMGLAMVASGVADAFYFFGLHVWDMAAGNILVTEAGGTVIDPAGGEVDIMSRRVLAAATQPLAFQLSAELTQNYPSPRDDQPRVVVVTKPEAVKKDFNAQTEFSDSSFSLGSDRSKSNFERDTGPVISKAPQ